LTRSLNEAIAAIDARIASLQRRRDELANRNATPALPEYTEEMRERAGHRIAQRVAQEPPLEVLFDQYVAVCFKAFMVRVAASGLIALPNRHQFDQPEAAAEADP
jgi:hypothetical protein